ncbi:TadE family protein [Streptomyces sp. NBC_00102]|uniref:TadE family protein n=1 Tax=Streptomyces sp. NBC_00102 TaxID=2975652 RepID=UPI00224E6141|nr:TadE family protein [Streptomyces sp. NBC_00102]MCX5399396.1 pilus assembly protein [Streptomyces sp. NBC_00102]
MTTTLTHDTDIGMRRPGASSRDGRPAGPTRDGSGRADGRPARRMRDGRRLRAATGPRRDRGQTAIEFLGMTPMIILIMLVLWELALVGYTFSLAGNAADKGARAGAGAEFGSGSACRQKARENLPDAWEGNAVIRCSGGSDLYRTKVRLKVPVLVPGLFDLDVHIDGDAASPQEG